MITYFSGFPALKDFLKLFDFLIVWIGVFLIKVILEAACVY
jgi:hypothetical protein